MKLLLALLLLTGCVSISETVHRMPDKTEVIVVRMDQRGIFTPSTAKEWEYRCHGEGENRLCMNANDSRHVYQSGIANDWGAAAINAGGYVGGLSLLSDATVKAAGLIGDGLSKSGVNQKTFVRQDNSRSIRFGPLRKHD